MNCPRCNTELPDSAIFCVNCGSTIRPASFSYLPTGVPAWPTEPLKSTQYRNEITSESGEFVVQSDASSVVPSSTASSQKTWHCCYYRFIYLEYSAWRRSDIWYFIRKWSAFIIWTSAYSKTFAIADTKRFFNTSFTNTNSPGKSTSHTDCFSSSE